MKKGVILAFCLTMPTLPISCRQIGSNPADIEEIFIDLSRAEGFRDLSKDFDPEFVITALETNDQCLLGTIKKIVFENNRYYILAEETPAIFIFDDQGRFINKLSRMGRGAGEYLSLTAFAVVGRDIWIYDNAGFKIRCYDENFQCTAEIPFAVSADEMEAVGDEIFLSCNDKGYDKINYHLYRYDTREQRMSSHLSFPAKPPGMLSIRINQPFAELQDSCLYHYRYCDTLYQIGGSSVEPRYRFVFSGHYRDEPILQSEFNPAESGVIRGLFGIRQTSNSIIFEYSFGNRPQYAIYNKKTKTCIAYESAMKIPPLGDLKIINYSIQAETLLAHFPAYLLLIPEFFDANKIDNPETKRMFEGVVSTLDENSNPVIMRFKLKPDANL